MKNLNIINILFLGFVVSIVGCTKINSFDLSSEFSSYNAGVITSNNMSVAVNMNQAKAFEVAYSASQTSAAVTDVKLSFDKDVVKESISTSVLGKVSILNQATMSLKYEPPFNFKGRDSVYAYIRHNVNGRPAVSRFEIAFVVTNPNPESPVFVNTLTVTVDKNSVNNQFVVASPVGARREPKFTFLNNGQLYSIATQQSGSCTITDAELGTFTYTPANMFTGVDSVTAYMTYLVEGVATTTQFTISFLVLNPNPDAAMISGDMAVETTFATPKAFAVMISNTSPIRKPTISFHATNPLINTTTTGSGGTVAVTDNDNALLLYTPIVGFRGTESITVYLIQQVEGIDVVTNFKITFIVRNPPLAGRPALAIRATECAMCHAQIKGNLITDGGYGVDYIGLNLAFGYRSSDNAIAFGGGTVATVNGVSASYPHNYYSFLTLLTGYPGYTRASITGEVVVPNINVPAGQYALGGATSLKNLLNANTPYTVTQKTSVYIGAPLSSAYLNYLTAPAKYTYFKEDQNSSWDLDGLVMNTVSGITVFSNDPAKVFVCEGDLVLDGSLYLKNLSLESDTGCRLYVSGTFAIEGPITYQHKSRRTNIQVTSAKAALIGIGNCPEASYIGSRGIYNGYGNIVRSAPSEALMATLNGQIVAEYNAMGSHSNVGCSLDPNGNAYGAFSANPSRYISYESLLINAPWVSSRYFGNFKGSIITESALMSLGNFYFEYDSVFDTVPILPLVPPSTYLQIVD